MSNFWTMCFPNAMCVPKSLVKIFVSIGNRDEKKKDERNEVQFLRGEIPPRRGAPPAAGTGSAIYFVPPNRIFPSVDIADTFIPVGRFRGPGRPRTATKISQDAGGGRRHGRPRRTAAGGIPW